MAESPTFARRVLGLKLREVRLAHDMKVEQVAKKVRTVATTVRRWENGNTGLSGIALSSLCNLYNVPDEEREILFALQEQGRKPGWWAPFDLPPDYQAYIGHELAAVEMLGYEPQFVPGLLQTADYARALISASLPDATDEQVETRVEARLRRQERLHGDDLLRVKVVLDESVLVRPIGGPVVMAAQLDHLAKAARRRHIKVQICPYKASCYSHAGSFALLAFPEPATSVVYVESLTGDVYAEGEAVERYSLVHENLRAAAASFEDSLEMLQRARDAMARS